MVFASGLNIQETRVVIVTESQKVVSAKCRQMSVCLSQGGGKSRGTDIFAVFCLPGSVLSMTPQNHPQGKYSKHPHLTDEETESQREKGKAGDLM